MNIITEELVDKFINEAKNYIQYILLHLDEYGLLYKLAESNTINQVIIRYTDFPLIDLNERTRIYAKLKTLAKEFFPNNCVKYDITFLELLYFFAMLVNPNYGWCVMDHICEGNRNHVYILSSSFNFLKH